MTTTWGPDPSVEQLVATDPQTVLSWEIWGARTGRDTEAHMLDFVPMNRRDLADPIFDMFYNDGDEYWLLELRAVRRDQTHWVARLYRTCEG